MGRPNTAEQKQKISASLKTYYAENGHPSSGRKISAEHKQKISASLKERYEREPLVGRQQTEETKKKISIAAQRARARARAPHLPEARRCSKCHQYKPAREFYIYYRKLVNGDKVPHLYPRCRQCEKTRTRRYMAGLSLEERRSKEAKWKRDARKRKRENKVPFVPVKPFVEWYLSLNGRTPTYDQLGDRLARAVHRAIYGSSRGAHEDLDERRMRLDIVDEVGVIVGETYLIHALYGDM